MVYADGVVIMGRRLQDVKDVFTLLVEQTNKMELVNKRYKTKFLISRKPYNENEYIKVGTYNFEIVKHYTYLGTILTNKNDLRPEIEKKNYKCKHSILCTSSSAKESISTHSRKKNKNL